MGHPFTLAGQQVYYHDENHASGYFHTYDGLQLDPSRDPPRKIHVFLPRPYEESADRFPVLYLNDGNTAFWPGGLSPYSWEVPKVLGELYQQRAIPPIIVVAIHPLNRSQEYLHVLEFSAPFQKEGGGLPDYAKYVVRLKQFIDQHYRTLGDRQQTTILGSSHGGLAAFYIGCLYAQYFGNVGAISPSFWVGGVFNLSETPLIAAVKGSLQSGDQNRPRLWIDWGLKRTGGFHNFVIEQQATRWGRKMVELLQRDYGYVQGLDLFQYEDETGGHDERAWSDRLGFVLKQFYQR
ncbi:alpha/beta hydrolase [Leptolyngbya sp. 'hensonii']|uniref:alpha/beta hydrolase n=1 Tax=Leptolyngbya sp. 'hensonii' TaxID=1922337 RepID=UPI0009500D7C|nr:alpha/beta hydrolase-fold protein [Leptolyngbya sp. 'hensonii']OLP17333.1 alpha/beta hydrolase [Leptolyngbya sp. 'hensonii']